MVERRRLPPLHHRGYQVRKYVVPLSATSRGAADPLRVTLSVLVLVVPIGMTIALFARGAGATPATRRS